MSIESFIINPEEDTPSINFDSATGNFVVSGMSRPEDVTKVYNPIIDWLKLYAETPVPNTNVDFKFAYFYTASARKIYEVLAVLDELNSSGKSEVKINWYFDEPDIDMKMAGEEYDELVEITMSHISVPIY